MTEIPKIEIHKIDCGLEVGMYSGTPNFALTTYAIHADKNPKNARLISMTHPAELKIKYKINEEIAGLWLLSKEQLSVEEARNYIDEEMKKGADLFCYEGIETEIQYHGFEKIHKKLVDLNRRCYEDEIAIILPVDQTAVEPKEFALLKRMTKDSL